jgi:hypothetical protein
MGGTMSRAQEDRSREEINEEDIDAEKNKMKSLFAYIILCGGMSTCHIRCTKTTEGVWI